MLLMSEEEEEEDALRAVCQQWVHFCGPSLVSWNDGLKKTFRNECQPRGKKTLLTTQFSASVEIST